MLACLCKTGRLVSTTEPGPEKTKNTHEKTTAKDTTDKKELVPLPNKSYQVTTYEIPGKIYLALNSTIVA